MPNKTWKESSATEEKRGFNASHLRNETSVRLYSLNVQIIVISRSINILCRGPFAWNNLVPPVKGLTIYDWTKFKAASTQGLQSAVGPIFCFSTPVCWPHLTLHPLSDTYVSFAFHSVLNSHSVQSARWCRSNHIKDDSSLNERKPLKLSTIANLNWKLQFPSKSILFCCILWFYWENQ